MSAQPIKRGRPPHEPTRARRLAVEVLAGSAVPIAQICNALDIPRSTLYRHYRPELRRGAARVEAELIRNLLRIAGGNDGAALKAIMFSLQSRFGWSQYAPPPSAPDAAGK
ncbi:MULTISPECIES: RNA polymerase subunit sigma-70 [unclassified Mesorhizobium]|uniref:RNA polymerase subunit sigma-70 n=1 Tax=unclassified Mesorhizobium TaxID=325217 RepID=UPI000FD22052|nr:MULTISPECIES: RNA polymerase subunit sigma-70 [unclassified Mesorhizobium]RVB76631.1 RNA polymerase subunit sigma-70 [Mesorhizobium sp. M6A.T.Cr.TU.014.01.1.1]RWN35831.1 MAG: RNA polymerase subunit sigma-70 [Mesorhizobium sp.]RWP47167.1 MAG: RNA polymerase subunit sigma-70 [Mesorhizobium sp.]RWP80474.1 MAG: RNA polymerase subunit sigma-70 [Mesorhizobium sp.]RWP96226.1 MAG: RNA polymerase subunit sigma-70 [Mesorhizobium sp.]